MRLIEELAFGKTYERAAAEVYVEKRWPGAQIIESPTYADLDWQVVQPRKEAPPLLLAWLEVKTRRIGSKQYEDTIVAYRKHDAARFGLVFFKVPTVCLVIFADTVATFDLHEAPDSKREIGRYDRPGVSILHALYLHSRFEWHPELLEPIMKRTNKVEAVFGV